MAQKITEINVAKESTAQEILSKVRNVADKDTAQQILESIGNPDDSGASASAGTVKGKINKLISDLTTLSGRFTSTRAGYIDAINTNAARLTSARTTKIDNIGATGDTGGSTSAGTVMGKLNALLTSWTSTRAGYVDRLANSTYGLQAIKNAIDSVVTNVVNGNASFRDNRVFGFMFSSNHTATNLNNSSALLTTFYFDKAFDSVDDYIVQLHDSEAGNNRTWLGSRFGSTLKHTSYMNQLQLGVKKYTDKIELYSYNSGISFSSGSIWISIYIDIVPAYK